MERLTLVTATIFNEDGNCESGTTWKNPDEAMDKVKHEAQRIAKERFNDRYNNAKGVIYNINIINVYDLPAFTVVHEI